MDTTEYWKPEGLIHGSEVLLILTIHRADPLDRGLTKPLLCLFVRLRQVSSSEQGDQVPVMSVKGKFHSEWGRRRGCHLIGLINKIRAKEGKGNWQATVRWWDTWHPGEIWPGLSLLLCFRESSTITLTGFSLRKDSTLFPLLSIRLETQREKRTILLLCSGLVPLALRLLGLTRLYIPWLLPLDLIPALDELTGNNPRLC